MKTCTAPIYPRPDTVTMTTPTQTRLGQDEDVNHKADADTGQTDRQGDDLDEDHQDGVDPDHGEDGI